MKDVVLALQMQVIFESEKYTIVAKSCFVAVCDPIFHISSEFNWFVAFHYSLNMKAMASSEAKVFWNNWYQTSEEGSAFCSDVFEQDCQIQDVRAFFCT